MATEIALIDVQKGELRLRIQGKKVTFNVFNAIKYPIKSDSCFRLDSVEAIVSSQVGQTGHLETSMLHGDSLELDDDEVASYFMWIDSFEPNRRKNFECLGESPCHPIL